MPLRWVQWALPVGRSACCDWSDQYYGGVDLEAVN